MKRFNLTFIVMALTAMMAVAQTDGCNTYDYSIQYHWGFIHETAGAGSVTVDLQGDRLNASLNGHSIPWDGRIYSVSDTLIATVSPSAETVRYINGWYTKPHVGQTADMGNPFDYLSIHGQGLLSADGETMEAISVTADMLGMYYYSQVLDFPSMSLGQQTSIPITRPDGVPQTLTISYLGEGTCSCGCGAPTYNLTFNYTYQGNPCPYNVFCQVNRNSLVPCIISADIRIGHVEMVHN